MLEPLVIEEIAQKRWESALPSHVGNLDRSIGVERAVDSARSGLAYIAPKLERMSQLAEQSQKDFLTTDTRDAYQSELVSLEREVRQFKAETQNSIVDLSQGEAEQTAGFELHSAAKLREVIHQLKNTYPLHVPTQDESLDGQPLVLASVADAKNVEGHVQQMRNEVAFAAKQTQEQKQGLFEYQVQVLRTLDKPNLQLDTANAPVQMASAPIMDDPTAIHQGLRPSKVLDLISDRSPA